MKKALFLAVLVALCAVSAAADEREEPIDVIIALDKSLSMVEEIEAVKDYVNTTLIDELLIPGDFFLVVSFYGQTEVPVAVEIGGNADKQRAKEIISRLLADGRFTDIGNALDVLGRQVETKSRPDKEKYLLLITDGIQEAPLESKYYSPDGTFNHEFLKNTKTIQMKGWKIEILGIGTFQAGEQLAEELGGTYTEISEEPTKEEIAEKTQDFLTGRLDVAGTVVLSGVNNKGRAAVTVTVSSKGYTEAQALDISGILLTLTDQGVSEEDILRQPVTIKVEPDGEQKTRIPVQLQTQLASGAYSGTLEFVFSSREKFAPVAMNIDVQVKGFFGNYWYLLLLALIVLAVIVVVLVVVVPNLFKSKLRFLLIVNGRKKEAQEYTLVEGKPLLMEEVEGKIAVVPTRSPNSIARLVLFQKGIRLVLLKPERFPKLREAPRNALGETIDVRTEDRKNLTVRLENP